MEWSDDGVVLAVRGHGEASAVVSMLTRDHGRHAGLVRGATGKRLRGVLQPGNLVRATWRARLSEHLGGFGCELIQAVAAEVMADGDRLAALAAASALGETALPEREPHPRVFDGLVALLAAMTASEAWPSAYVKWELGLLGELGFGLDLDRCAVTGGRDGLAFVSPRTGRAVCRRAAEPYRARLLVLPPFLLAAGGAGSAEEVAQGLVLTGHFLERHLYASGNRPLPAARHRLAEKLARRAGGRDAEPGTEPPDHTTKP
ncbi:MAG: DNA repair protein RecO [Rhodospirillales bacterium]